MKYEIATRSEAANVLGASVDVAEATSVTLIIDVQTAGSVGSFAIQESDDNSSFTAVDAEDIIGTLDLSETGTQLIGYRGYKRYVKVVAPGAGGATIAAYAFLGDVIHQP